jgi:aconitate hydratase
MFRAEYRHIFRGNEDWNAIPAKGGTLFAWDPDSTYIREPSFFNDLSPEPLPPPPIRGARALALLGDSITTDHISPAGAIPADSPAGRYLVAHGVQPRDFNSYGARRGNHEVMVRGTFANIRLRNQLAPGTEGGFTRLLPDGTVTTIYDASVAYAALGTPLIVLAGAEYGTGSSRDWAAKGTYLLGVRAVIAKSYERIHRSNLIGMGVIPLQFAPGEGWAELGLTGEELYDVLIPDPVAPRQDVSVQAVRSNGSSVSFSVTARIDSPIEARYYTNGGILHTVLRDMLRAPVAQAS